MYDSHMRKKQPRRIKIQETKRCLDRGMNEEQIAKELGVSQRTVRNYIKYIRDNQ